jgi:IclR family pca regulon transcriptional regulator
MNDRDHVQSVAKCFAILGHLASPDSPFTLDDLTRRTGFNKTTCFRFLKTLRQLGLVEQNMDQKTYHLGPAMAALGLKALKGLNLRQAALPVMQALRDETEETVNLSLLSGTEIIFVERVMSDYLVNVNINIGDRLPVYCASMGKVILAFMAEPHADAILAQLDFKSRTERTIVSAAAFKTELAEIKKRGYALNNEELEKGLRAVAAPIIGYTGEAFAAINIAWTTARHPSRRTFTDFAAKVVRAAEQISLAMGFMRPDHSLRGGFSAAARRRHPFNEPADGS